MAKSRQGVFEVVGQATQEGSALLCPHSFCFPLLFLIHTRAWAAMVDFWQLSQREDRY